MEGIVYCDRNKTNSTNWIGDKTDGYIKVYFRINTKDFDCANGYFNNEDSRTAFHTEISEIISTFGIVESCGYKQNNEYLHVHPQNISGIIAKSKVRSIAEAINNSESTSIRWVDLYAEYVYMTDEEYINILNEKRAEIAQNIVKESATKRTNQYVSLRDVAISTHEKFKINRINSIEDINRPKITYRFIVEVVKQLVNNGYLVQIEDYSYIRSLNKGEQKKAKVDYMNWDCVNTIALNSITLIMEENTNENG